MNNMRTTFGEALVEIAKKRQDFVVLDADVAGGTGTNIFRDTFPDRFIQCGIAEQNMMSVAAGVASTGLIPVVTGYAIFLAMRAIEQVRNSIAYPDFNVKIAASHLGLDVGPDGATHQAIEDIAIMRAIPNMTIVAPADPIELRSAIPTILDHQGPVYLRTGRSPLPNVYTSPPSFHVGKSTILTNGSDAAIVAVGVMVNRALLAANILKKENINVTVANISTIKPLDTKILLKIIQKCGCIVSAEDHNIKGGLGGAVAEFTAQFLPCPMEFIGINDCFGESGEPEDLAVKYNLTAEDIADAVRRVIRRKNT